MKVNSKINVLKSRSDSVTSGILYVGSHAQNFYLAIRCPIHVATVIRKAFQASSIDCRFYSGSVTISQLVLPCFRGHFIYRDLTGKPKKYNAAFVYPLDVINSSCEDDFTYISAVLSVMSDNKYSYFDENNRSIKTLFTLFAPDFVEYVDSLIQAFDAPKTGVSTTKTQ